MEDRTDEYPVVPRSNPKERMQSGMTDEFPVVKDIVGSHADKNYLITRRRLLGATAALVGLAAIRSVAPRMRDEDNKDLLNVVDTGESETASDLESANTVLHEEMFDESGKIRLDRTTAELVYADKARTLEEIDLGICVCFNENAVLQLLEKRSALRQKGHPDLPSLSGADAAFAEKYIHHPERFAMCVDAVREMKAELPKLWEEIRVKRSDELPASPTAEDIDRITINPAYLYQLMIEETSGLTFRGSAPAIQQYRGEYVGSEQILTEYIQKIREATGIEYDVNDIPGSQAGTGDASGGAIGIQFMPGNAEEFRVYMEKIGGDGNIFDPMEGLRMAIAYFAFRNYTDGDFDTLKEGFMTWNPKESEAQSVATMGIRYEEFTKEALETS